MKNNKSRAERGFTLIEMLIAIVIMTVLAGALLSLQYIISQNQISAWRSYTSVDEANTSLSILSRELRTARNGDNGAYTLESAENNQLIFYSDADFDGDTEKVRYFLNGTQFSKGTIKPVGYPVTYPADQEKIRTLSKNVRNDTTPIFYYYNGDWPEDTINNPLDTPARPSEVKLVRIYLLVNTNKDQPDKDYLLESYTQVRMVKENL